MESLKNHLFFCTLTYNNEFLPEYILPDGDIIHFADFLDIDLLFKRLRNKDAFTRPFRYICVSERGGKKHRPHFHILFLVPKYEGDDYNTCLDLQSKMRVEVLANWCRNLGGRRRSADYHPLCTFKERWYAGKLHTNYDLHYVVPNLSTNGVSDVAFYVLKYMLKPSKFEKHLFLSLKSRFVDYLSHWDIIKSRRTNSKGLGLPFDEDVVKYLRSCIGRSDVSLGYPQYFSPTTGQAFPLAHYYRNYGHIYSFADCLPFSMEFEEPVDMDITQKIIRFSQFDKILEKVNEHETQVYYDLV